MDFGVKLNLCLILSAARIGLPLHFDEHVENKTLNHEIKQHGTKRNSESPTGIKPLSHARVIVEKHNLHYLLPSLKFTIFIIYYTQARRVVSVEGGSFIVLGGIF